MTNGDGIVYEVNCIPFQPQRLAAAQTIESTKEYRNFQICASGGFEELLDLIAVIEAACIPGFLGTLNFVSRIGIDHLCFDCIFQCLMDVSMVMDHRVSADAFELFCIELLYVGWF